MRKTKGPFPEPHRVALKKARELLILTIDPTKGGIQPIFEEFRKVEELVEEIEHLLGY